MLSQFVYETENSLYHSLTGVKLPIGASNELLGDNLFLKHQNIDAIKNRLARPSDYLSLTLVPTWECNLRCTHCCVLSELKKRDAHKIDKEKLYKFLDEFFTKFTHVKTFEGYFLGGESLIYPLEVLALMDACDAIQKKHDKGLTFAITTNLAMDFTLDHVKCFDRLTNIGVSLDGLEIEHNAQRKGFSTKGINPFQKTVDNIHRLVDLGYRNKIVVQAALKDEYLTEEYIVKYTKFCTSLGVHLKQVLVGSIFPTKQNQTPSQLWLNHRKNNDVLNVRPCCKYRYMSKLQVNSNNTVFDNFYTTKNSQLGTLDDNIDSICQRNMDLIFEHMPALNDENCLACPALGYCWGGCINSHVFSDKPSTGCAKEKLVPKVQQLAIKGKLIGKHA